MIDAPSTDGSPNVPSLVALAKEWGIDVGNDIVLDASGMGRAIGAGPQIPLAMSYPPHPVTDGFRVADRVPVEPVGHTD